MDDMINKIIRKIKESETDNLEVELTGLQGQKLIVPLCKADSVSLETIGIITKKAGEAGIDNVTIRDVLDIYQDAYWWLQTLTLLFNRRD